MSVNSYMSDFQFVGSTIKSFHLENQFIDFDEKAELDRVVDVSYEVKYISPEKTSKETDYPMLGIIVLYTTMTIGGDNSCPCRQEDGLKLSLTLEGCFKTKTLNRDEFKEMLELNGCATLYSIARAIIISITSQTFSDGPCVLPMINVYNMVDQQDEEQDHKD